MRVLLIRFGPALLAAWLGMTPFLGQGVAVRIAASPTSLPAMPGSNLPPVPAYFPPCEVMGNTVVNGLCQYVPATGTFSYNSPAAARAALAALNNALGTQGLSPIRVTGAFWNLTEEEQFFILTDAIRVEEGLPPAVALEPAANSVALAGAKGQTDPTLPTNTAWQGRMGSVWSGGEGAVESLYNFLYQDGYGSDNLDCTTPNAPGCWGHRQVLLDHYGPTPVMGVAETRVNGTRSLGAILLSSPLAGDSPSFTWQKGQAFLQSPMASSAPLPFQDLGTVPWAVPAITDLYRRGLIQGLSPTRFGPNQPVTVGMGAVLLDRLLPPAPSPADAVPPVAAPGWAAPALERLAAEGFSLPQVPADIPLTRLQLARLLAGLLHLSPPATPAVFADTVSLSAPDREAIAAVTAAGLLAGVSPGRFQPQGTVNRAQMAVVLDRIAQAGSAAPSSPG